MTEDQLHRSVAEQLTWLIAEPGKTRDDAMWFSVELRNAKSAVEGYNRQKRGCIAGLMDICIVHDGRLYGIELKKADGRLSQAQKALHPELNAAGVPIALCRSVDDVARALAHWAIPHRRVS